MADEHPRRHLRLSNNRPDSTRWQLRLEHPCLRPDYQDSGALSDPKAATKQRKDSIQQTEKICEEATTTAAAENGGPNVIQGVHQEEKYEPASKKPKKWRKARLYPRAVWINPVRPAEGTGEANSSAEILKDVRLALGAGNSAADVRGIRKTRTGTVLVKVCAPTEAMTNLS